MKNLTLKNVAKSFQRKSLFTNVSLSLSKGERVALIGNNGCGKSTLLKIAAGIESATTGHVSTNGGSIAYLSQHFAGDESLSILEYLDTHHATSKVFGIIDQFATLSHDALVDAYVYELSGGQKRVLEIATILSQAPLFLCVDEPENHLDIAARETLMQLLKKYWGGVLLVSHDQYMIDQLATKIMLIQDEQAVLMSGQTYGEFMQAEAQKMHSSLAHWKAESRALDKLEDSVRMLKARTRYNDAQAKTYQMKKRELAERREALGQRPDQKKEIGLDLAPVKKRVGKLIFRCEKLCFSYYAQVPMLQDINLELRAHQKVLLLGRNGSGKSTFVKLLQSVLTPTAGSIKRGNDLSIRFVNQSFTLDQQSSPLEHLIAHGYTEEKARGLLAQFVFSQSEAQSTLGSLSGGQQQRFTLLFIFLTTPDFLVLDEPSNNLDPDTWNLLLRLVNEYTGSLLLISHDRRFIEQVEDTRLWVLHNGQIQESWEEIADILPKL